jgi:sugar lactone lactonase YvrE
MNRFPAIRTALTGLALVMLRSYGDAIGARVLTTSETLSVVATGLNNPRGLTIGPDGALYVAEAGRGGDGACAEGPEGLRCYGATGSVARIDLKTGAVKRIATGLPSAATPDGSFATGPHDVSFSGLGRGAVTIGYAGDPANRTRDFGIVGKRFARLVRLTSRGGWRLEQDLGAYELTVNPTGDESDSNPYGVLALAGRQIVSDAGANALNAVAADGSVATLATFPNTLAEAPDFLGLPPGTLLPMDAVPTSVAIGPDGSFYVGQLNGFPFPVGAAKVFRVPAHGGEPEVFADGFTAIIDVAFGPDGSLYVLEIARNGLLAAFIEGDWRGALIRVAPDGTRTELARDSLFAPGGLVVAGDGSVFVATNSVFSSIGTVLRITR